MGDGWVDRQLGGCERSWHSVLKSTFRTKKHLLSPITSYPWAVNSLGLYLPAQRGGDSESEALGLGEARSVLKGGVPSS